jgi:hypothetical protein
MREMLPELKGNNGNEVDLKGLVPLIQGAIRAEMAKLPLHQMSSGGQVGQETGAMFKDAVYTPTVNTDGMVSNVSAKETGVSGDSAMDALAALRRLNSIPNKT